MKFNKKWLWLIIPILIFSLVCLNTSSVSTVLLAIQGAITDGNLVKFSGTNGIGVDAGLSATNIVKCKFDATSAPTVNNDVDEGYVVGSRWCDVTNNKEYICLDNSDGNAIWIETTQSGSGGAFIDLTDTPANYTGNSLKIVRLNVGETALEFAAEVDPTVDTDAEIKAILVDEVTKTGDFTAGRIAKINNATGIIEQGTNTDTDVADAVTKKHTQGSDTTLGTMTADVNMGTHKLTGLSVPSASGQSVRTTATITEANLEDAITKKHTQNTDTAAGGEWDFGAHSAGFTIQTATGDGTTTINWTLGNYFKFTHGAMAETFTFNPAPTKPSHLTLIIIQDGVGGRDSNLPATVKWLGAEPTWTDGGGGKGIVVAMVYDGTNYWSQGTPWEE